MAIKRLRDMYNDYIQIGDFEKTIEVNSPTYGIYKMTKIATIDLIKACENMRLGPVHEFYSKLKTEFVTSKSVSLESKRFGERTTGQNLPKFEFYVPILEDNLDWEVPKGSHTSFKQGRLPVAYKKEYIQDIINKIKS